MIGVIDGGTTNTRVYLVEGHNVIAQAKRKVGVKDTAISGNNELLKKGIQNCILEAIKLASCKIEDIEYFVTSGMITSELGLLEIPHLVAPANISDLASSIVKKEGNTILPFDIPIYFIRGIKNIIHGQNNDIDEMEKIDFMRGEEVQAIGILNKFKPKTPTNILIIGSHTKLIHINSNNEIVGSITTISGQFYEAIINGTFLSKCIRQSKNESLQSNFSNIKIIDIAFNIVEKGGLLRAMMMPRFMQVLMSTNYEDRNLFIDAAIVAEDIKILDEAKELGFDIDTDFYLFGQKNMCELYSHTIKKRNNSKYKIVQIFEEQQLRDITIEGSQAIIKQSNQKN